MINAMKSVGYCVAEMDGDRPLMFGPAQDREAADVDAERLARDNPGATYSIYEMMLDLGHDDIETAA